MKRFYAALCALIMFITILPAGAEEVEEVDTTLVLLGSSIAVMGSGAAFESGVVRLTRPGTYHVSGELTEGQLWVEVSKEEKVTLSLEGVTITNTAGACIYVACADRVIIDLQKDSVNTLQSGAERELKPDDEAEGGAIWAKDDLRIKGKGTLNVYGYINNGIQTSNDLEIRNGSIAVQAANKGLKGKDSVTIEGGTIRVTSGDEGVDTDGTLTVTGGTLDITAGGGYESVKTAKGNDRGGWGNQRGGWGGGRPSSGTTAQTVYGKGMKADTALIISGGDITIDSADDALHTNGALEISGGKMVLSTSDDAIHADVEITISGGEISAEHCYEGIESKTILISGGDIYVNATDDGINAADPESSGEEFGPGGMGGPGGWGGMGGPGGMGGWGQGRGGSSAATVDTTDLPVIRITGGKLVVLAGYDGFDANGWVSIEGGDIIVKGANQTMDGALDWDYFGVITGGTLLGIGGMNGSFSSSSTQYSFSASFRQATAAGELFTVADEDGSILYSCELPAALSMFIFSCPGLDSSASYTITAGSQVGIWNKK